MIDEHGWGKGWRPWRRSPRSWEEIVGRVRLSVPRAAVPFVTDPAAQLRRTLSETRWLPRPRSLIEGHPSNGVVVDFVWLRRELPPGGCTERRVFF
jgi:hypothetical protein